MIGFFRTITIVSLFFVYTIFIVAASMRDMVLPAYYAAMLFEGIAIISAIITIYLRFRK